MSLTKQQIKTAAMELDPVEREALAEELLLSISDSEREQIEAEWLDEAKRRDAAFLAGQMTASPVEDVIDRIRRKVRP